MNANTTAGHSVRQTSHRLYGEAASRALGAIVLFVIGVAIGARAAGGVAAIFVAGGLFLAFRAWQRADSAKGYRLGAIAEERVGARLWEVETWGWSVEHDVAKRGGGNVDHVVHTPKVTFTIDTKRSRWRGADLGQAHRHADWAARYYGGDRLVVPVICVQRSSEDVKLVDDVYIVGATRLVGFLLERG